MLPHYYLIEIYFATFGNEYWIIREQCFGMHYVGRFHPFL